MEQPVKVDRLGLGPTSAAGTAAVEAVGPQVPTAPARLAEDAASVGRSVARASGVVLGGKLFAYATRVLIGLLVARTLGAERYGSVSLAVTVAAFAASLTALGLDSAVIRWVAVSRVRGDIAGIKGALQVGIGLPAMCAGAAGIFIVVFADALATDVLHQPAVAGPLRIVALGVPLLAINQQLFAGLQGLRRIDLAVLADQVVQPVVRLALLVAIVVVSTLTVTATASVAVIGIGVTSLVLAGSLVRLIGRHHPPGQRRPREMVAFAIPVYFSNVVTALGANAQLMLLGAMGTLASVGIFAVADQVNLLSTLFHASVVAASMPLFAELQDRPERSGLATLYRDTSRWTFTLDLPIFLVIVLFAQDLLGIFGPEFREGATALILLSLMGLVNSATGTSGALLDMTGHTRVKLVNSTVLVLLVLGLDVLLIPPFGMVGAALAALLATGTVNLLRLLQVHLLLRLHPYDRSYLRPLVAGAVALAATLLSLVLTSGLPAPLPTALGIAVLLGTYGAIIARNLGAADRALLGRIRDRLVPRRGRT